MDFENLIETDLYNDGHFIESDNANGINQNVCVSDDIPSEFSVPSKFLCS